MPTIAKLCYGCKQYFAWPVGQTHGVPSKSINTIFAENLRQRMDAGGWSQATLAKKTGVAQTSISNYLSPERRAAGAKGKEPSAKLTEMAMIAEALTVSPWEMLIPSFEAQDAETEQQVLEVSALMREMPPTARMAIVEQARVVHRATRPASTSPPLGGDSVVRRAA